MKGLGQKETAASFQSLFSTSSAVISNNQIIKQVAGGIRAKMRSIDEIGWLNEQKIGVLLPVTNFQGGRRFVSRVCESERFPCPSIPSNVFTYPQLWPTDSNGNHRGGSGQEDRAHQFSSLEVLGGILYQKIPSWKRLMDVAGALLLIVLLSPMFLLLSIYIKCTSTGKVIFRQERVGYKGKLFSFLKFRTMRENNDSCSHRDYLKELIRSSLPMEKLDRDRDPRIIPGGRVLRKACLDELPQLFNVLRGEMSLVGPRPCIPYEAEEYLRWHTQRFDILPGMTGLWQVSGKNKLSFEQMIRLDIAYTNRMSPMQDLKILLLTLPTVIGLVLEAGVKKLRGKAFASQKEHLRRGSEKGTLGNA